MTNYLNRSPGLPPRGVWHRRAGLSAVVAGVMAVWLAREVRASWDITPLDAGTDAGLSGVSLAIFPNGWPAVAYTRDGWLMFGVLTDQGWGTLPVAPAGDGQVSLQITPSSVPAISFYDGFGTLSFATLDPNGWVVEVVDGNPGTGRYNSLAILVSGRPAISYSDETAGDLRYAWHDGQAWLSTAVDTEGEVGTYNSLTLLEFGQPAISYHDATNGDLKYAWYEDGKRGWNTTTVDSVGDTGRDTWLTVVYGQPAISYRGASGELRYTRFDGASWQGVVVDSDADAGWTTCLNTLPQGRAAIAHWHKNAGLKFSWHDGTFWHTAVVQAGDVGQNSRLGILPSGLPVLLYRDVAGQALNYAQLDADSDCNHNVVPDALDVLGGTSADCNSNFMPDECELSDNDCNGNLVPDDCELSDNDCNGNFVPDDCELSGNDCNGNLVPDDCELCDNDCNGNLVPDDCELSGNDCNGNLVPDDCELSGNDCNGNRVPDECEPDGDGDRVIDDCDDCPADPFKTAPGICGCNVPDADSDDDGTLDCNDGCPHDPLKTLPGACGCDIPDTDSDGDGTPNCLDGCPNDAGKTAAGVCGCGVPDTDSDRDGVPDCHDGCPSDPLKTAPGACGCGTPDEDSDGDGTPDCSDSCPSDPLKVAAGACGCGTPDTDTDGDGVPDCIDNCRTVANPGQADADQDGLGDACEDAQSEIERPAGASFLRGLLSLLRGTDPNSGDADVDHFLDVLGNAQEAIGAATPATDGAATDGTDSADPNAIDQAGRSDVAVAICPASGALLLSLSVAGLLKSRRRMR